MFCSFKSIAAMSVLVAGAAMGSATFASAQDNDKKDKGNTKPVVSYYPLEVGNQWTYKVTVGENSNAAILTISKVETFDKLSLSKLEVKVNGEVKASEHLRQTAQGVFRHRQNGVAVDPPLCLIQYPVKAGAKWQGELKDVGRYFCEAKEDTVEVPAGKYQAMRVTIRTEDKGQKVTQVYWFVKDVGFVKQTVDIPERKVSVDMELEKFERAAMVSAGERLVMVKHYVKDVDRNQNQLLGTMLIPKGWKTKSNIEWDLHNHLYPFTMSQQYSAPDNSVVVEFQSDIGRILRDQDCPKDVIAGLLLFAREKRPGARNLKVVNSKTTKWMPEGPGMLQYGTIVLSYTIGNREVEEEFTGNLLVNTTTVGNMSTKAGYLGGIRAISADKGKLAQVRAIGVAMHRSGRDTPEFIKAVAVASKGVTEVNLVNIRQNIKDGQYYQMVKQQIDATWKETCEKTWAASDRRMEEFRDVLGGVNRFTSTKNSYEVTLPLSHKHAWEGPNDTYILTNDPSYRPDADFNGQWDRLKLKN